MSEIDLLVKLKVWRPMDSDRPVRYCSLFGLAQAVALLLTCVGVWGCGSSPTTLAVENPAVSTAPDEQSRPINNPANAAPGSRDPIAPAATGPSHADSSAAKSNAQPGQATDVPAADESTDKKMLKPKLDKVDPATLIGQWKDSFFGTRTLTLNDDGSAQMVLDLDFAGRLLYGNRLEFEMKWTLEGAVIGIDVVSGKPESSARSAMKTWGERYVYLLDAVSDDRIEMRDWDGAASYTLKKVSLEKAAEPKP